MGGNAELFTRKAQMLFGCGFDADAVDFRVQSIRKKLTHLWNMGSELWGLRQDSSIDISD